MKGRFWVIYVLWVILAPWRVMGDGTIIHPTAFAKVEIPDQRALIHFSNGVETLVIDTSFKGEGSNFAWIVPVPSEPIVEEATPGLFATLQIIFQPKVVHNVGKYYQMAIAIGVVMALFIWARKAQASMAGLLLFLLFMIIISSLLLPATSTVSGSVSVGNVQIINRKSVGAYETTTLLSQDGSALLAWLAQNGYATPTNLLPAIQAYAREGWYFVASKLRADEHLAGPARAHPLLFRFKTEAPVYPLRLTGVGNTNCVIDLYVFGPGMAQTPSFRVVRSDSPSYVEPAAAQVVPNSNVLRVRHPLLRKIVTNSVVATKLNATLSSATMQKDSYITWVPYQRVCPIYYSREGSAIFALNILVVSLVTAALIWLLLFGIGARWANGLRRACGWMAVIGVVGSAVTYSVLPRIEVTLSMMPRSHLLNTVRQLTAGLSSTWKAEKGLRGTTNDPDVNWVRKQLTADSEFRRSLGSDTRRNAFTGTDWKEEDSPGNYTLRMKGDSVVLVWYDLNGAEMVESPFESKAPPK